jgi:hypothetical protein
MVSSTVEAIQDMAVKDNLKYVEEIPVKTLTSIIFQY